MTAARINLIDVRPADELVIRHDGELIKAFACGEAQYVWGEPLRPAAPGPRGLPLARCRGAARAGGGAGRERQREVARKRRIVS
jgi:hypothetical protein